MVIIIAIVRGKKMKDNNSSSRKKTAAVKADSGVCSMADAFIVALMRVNKREGVSFKDFISKYRYEAIYEDPKKKDSYMKLWKMA